MIVVLSLLLYHAGVDSHAPSGIQVFDLHFNAGAPVSSKFRKPLNMYGHQLSAHSNCQRDRILKAVENAGGRLRAQEIAAT